MSQSALGTRQSAVWLLALVAAWGLVCAGTPDAPRVNGPTPLAVEQALEDLKSGDWVLKWAAMSQLARWKVKEAAPPIKAVLAGKDQPWVRGRALVALAELAGEPVLDDALAAAKDATPELRTAAVEALGILAGPRAEAAIAERLKDAAPPVRHQAIVALARVQRDKAWGIVAPLLDDADPVVALHAVRALVYIARPEAAAKAIALLEHKDPGVRAEAAATLGKALVPEAIRPLLYHMAADGEERVRVACERALAAFTGQALMLPMLGTLRGEPVGNRYQAALHVLATRPTSEACEGVAALLREQNGHFHDVLPYAFELLARLDPSRYQDVFTRYLDNPSPTVRGKAVECISKCPKADQFKLLRPMLLDKEHGVRSAAFRAIRDIADAAPPEGMVDYLADALQSADRATRRAAVELLCERVTAADLPKAIGVLGASLGSKDKEERDYTAKALARIGDDAARRRIALAQGFVADWMLLGPFPYDSRNKGYGAAYVPEHQIDFARTYPPIVADPTAVFRVGEATCGGVARKALLMQPPTGHQGTPGGKLIATFWLELPAAKDLKLALALGLEDGTTESDGVQIELFVNGDRLLEKKLTEPGPWQLAEVSLADYAGKKAAIEFAVDPLGNPKNDRAAIAEPRLVAGDQTLATLTEMADAAPVRVAQPEAKPSVPAEPGAAPREARGTLAWQRYQVTRIDGEVSLYDVYPAPLEAKLAYGVADLVCPGDCKAQVNIKSDDGFVLWLDGAKVMERPGAGEAKADIILHEGRRRFLIKVFNHRDWWLYHLRLTDPDGRAIEFRQEGK